MLQRPSYKNPLLGNIDMPPTESAQNRARTKIVATIGPACCEVEELIELLRAGVDVFRINMAHGSRAEHEGMLAAVREAGSRQGRPVGVLVDLAGPKIRLGQLFFDPTECHVETEFSFVRGSTAGAADELVSGYPALVDELSVGNRVLLADGIVQLTVVDRQRDRARCRVVAGGTIRSRQGIHLPGVELSAAPLDEADRDNAVWAARGGVDFVGLSFVRSGVEVRQLQNLIREEHSHAKVIAKIEKQEALDHLEEIVGVADGVMVARGDLGVEIDVAEMAVVQKRIIATCNRLGKPVIVATQMLDSMQRSPRPTRAEATDVANAILDGADACMLSGETAVGINPSDAVEMMNRIMLSAEELLRDGPPIPPAEATP